MASREMRKRLILAREHVERFLHTHSHSCKHGMYGCCSEGGLQQQAGLTMAPRNSLDEEAWCTPLGGMPDLSQVQRLELYEEMSPTSTQAEMIARALGVAGEVNVQQRAGEKAGLRVSMGAD